MYQTAKDRQTKERQDALLWLYLTSQGLVSDFTEFCKQRQGLTLEQIDNELKQLTK